MVVIGDIFVKWNQHKVIGPGLLGTHLHLFYQPDLLVPAQLPHGRRQPRPQLIADRAHVHGDEGAELRVLLRGRHIGRLRLGQVHERQQRVKVGIEALKLALHQAIVQGQRG